MYSDHQGKDLKWIGKAVCVLGRTEMDVSSPSEVTGTQ